METRSCLPLYERNQENLAHISAVRPGTRAHREGQCAPAKGGAAALTEVVLWDREDSG